MKLLTDWGFSREGWRSGEKGEYWVVMQGLLFLGFALLPIYRPISFPAAPYDWGVRGVAIALGLAAIALLLQGVFNLGANLTPLPYPKNDGQLVQTGAYGLVRHPLYGGILGIAIAWTVFHLSLSHLVGTLILGVFLDAKATREERWLTEKYPDYPGYQQRVKKLLPWIY